MPRIVLFAPGPFGDFCELRDRVQFDTVGELAEVVECHSEWRERRADFYERYRCCEGAARGEPGCPLMPCEILPEVFYRGRGECVWGVACPFPCGCTCSGGPRPCRD
ncbi:MAG: hypothetical protein H6723_12410 [Sandaracinus sp.]|nr:hypothetical protein [Sandaracinus sp.]